MQLHPQLLASLQLAREQLAGHQLVQPTGQVPLLPHPAAAPAGLLLSKHTMRPLMIQRIRGSERKRGMTVAAAAAAVSGTIVGRMAAVQTREDRTQMVMRIMPMPCRCKAS